MKVCDSRSDQNYLYREIGNCSGTILIHCKNLEKYANKVKSYNMDMVDCVSGRPAMDTVHSLLRSIQWRVSDSVLVNFMHTQSFESTIMIIMITN